MAELLTNTYFAFFLIVGLGILIGNISIKGISLDISAIIFVALVFGHYGVQMPDIFQKIGLILFIYSVGIQAGPGFFESFKSQGLNLILLAVIVILSGAAVSVILAYSFDIDFALIVGIFTGALTSTPGLAAAIESTGSTLASIGYGIAYPFGVIGVILFVRLAPKIFRVDIKQAEEDFEKGVHKDYPQLINKNYIVENPNVFGKSIGELSLRSMTNANVSRVLQNGAAFTPGVDTVLNKGDIIKAVGTPKDLEKIKVVIGKETDMEIPLSKKYSIQSVLVSNKNVVDKTLGDLGLFAKYNATVTRIRRSGIDITPTSNSKLRFGDKLTVASSEGSMVRVKELLGDSSKKLSELDFLPVSFGIIAGILIGLIQIPLFGFNFSLGLTGGVLVSSLILSKIGKTGSIIWNVAGSSNQLLRKIGLIFFLAAVGTSAGEHLVETINEQGLALFGIGAIITVVPMVLALVIGHYFLKVNFLTLIGSLTGSMTSTPALSAVDPMTESNAPKIAYATVYPIALVILVIASQIMGRL